MAHCTLKLKRMQRSGTEAIRTQIQPSKPKRGIANITNSQNTKRTCGQPSEQLFPKRWPLSNRNRTKNNMNTHKVKRHRNSDAKTGKREPQQKGVIFKCSREIQPFLALLIKTTKCIKCSILAFSTCILYCLFISPN